MLYCPKCGKEVKNEDRYCDHCGTRIDIQKNIVAEHSQGNQQGFVFDKLNVGVICAVISAVTILYVGIHTFTGTRIDREIFIHSSTVVFLNLIYLATGISSFFLLKSEKTRNTTYKVYTETFLFLPKLMYLYTRFIL